MDELTNKNTTTTRQEGDAAAAAALEQSLRAQTHRLLAQVSAYLRGVVRVLGELFLFVFGLVCIFKCGAPASFVLIIHAYTPPTPPHTPIGREQQQQPQRDSAAAADPADLDGLLILARACLLLLHHASGGNPLLRLGTGAGTTPSQQHKKGAGSLGGSLSGKGPAAAAGGGGLRIDRVQLESAFTIADTRGVGELAPEVCVCAYGLGLNCVGSCSCCWCWTDASSSNAHTQTNERTNERTEQELKEALDALGFSSSKQPASSQQAAAEGATNVNGGNAGVEGFASATFPELALLCRCERGSVFVCLCTSQGCTTTRCLDH